MIWTDLYQKYPSLFSQKLSSSPPRTDWGSDQWLHQQLCVPARQSEQLRDDRFKYFTQRKKIMPRYLSQTSSSSSSAASRSFQRSIFPPNQLSFTTAEQDVPSHLPPVGVLLVDHMKDVSPGKGQACLFTGDQVVCGRIIVEVWLQINLQFRV